MLVRATVVAEVGYPLTRDAGPGIESLFLRSLAEGDFAAAELTTEDYARMADLVVTYGNLPLGTTDASVIAIAERLKLTEVAHWTGSISRWFDRAHVNALTSLP